MNVAVKKLETFHKGLDLVCKIIKLLFDNWRYVLPLFALMAGGGSWHIWDLNNDLEIEKKHKSAIIESAKYREELLQPIIKKSETVIIQKSDDCPDCKREIEKLKEFHK